jgi:hypothetical protein
MIDGSQGAEQKNIERGEKSIEYMVINFEDEIVN